MVQKNEKGLDFEPDTGICPRRGMTIREYEDHGKPPCRGSKGERSDAFLTRQTAAFHRLAIDVHQLAGLLPRYSRSTPLTGGS